MHLVDEIPKPIIFAHRGASKYAPENTIAAFDLAVEQGIHAFELDTMLSRDGTPVVIHDREMCRTTGKPGRVDELMVDTIKRLDAGIWFSPDFKGEKIPLLKEVLIHFKKNILINIELKNMHSPCDPLPDVVLDMVLDLHMEENVLLSSFLPDNLRRLRKRSKKVKVALLCSRGLIGRLCGSRLFYGLSPDFIHPHKSSIQEALIRKEHDRGRRINTWTVDDKDIANRLISMGVDGLITNDPKLMLD